MRFRKSIFDQKENTKDAFDITNFTYNNWDDILESIFEKPTIEEVGIEREWALKNKIGGGDIW